MLRVNNISFAYQIDTPVLKDLSFELEAGEHLCVMGESGCGKSTLLKALYGLLDLDQGNMSWKGQPILGPAYNLVPGMPFFKYVAQENDLMPFTTVADNVSKYLSRIDMEESKRRTDELLEVIGMTEFAEIKVKNLSGGQKQRVALARALALNPEILLLDEPFSQVDNFKKNALRRTLFAYLKERNIACVVATHDSDDALSFSDRMLVIKENRLHASGSPAALFKNPPTKYVASLFDDVNEISIKGEKVLLYPVQLRIVEGLNKGEMVSHSGKDLSSAKVLRSYYKGTHWLIQLSFQDQVVFVNHPKEVPVGEEVTLKIREE
jgi:ABC-type Fe3+/spermidine/putrescine transport system ATPase subunit